GQTSECWQGQSTSYEDGTLLKLSAPRFSRSSSLHFSHSSYYGVTVSTLQPVAFVGMCFVVANFPGSRLPLDAVAVVIIMDRVAACFFDKPHTETLMHSAVLLWGALFVFNSLFLDGMGVAYGVWGRWSVQSIPGSTFTAPTLAGFSSFDTGYVHFINDGLALAQQYRRPDDTIASLDFSNPFPYAFAIRPAWGGASTGLQFRTNFD